MWKKKVEAGILLYALLMAAVFSLLLQFYLNRQVSSQRLQLFNRERTDAYAMAVLTKATAKDDNGEMEFEQGKARLSIAGKGKILKSAVSSAADIPIPLLLPFLRRRKKLRKTRKQLPKKRKRFRTKLGNRTNITVKSL